MNKTALISVSDKTGIVEFATSLAQRGVRILSTGGTAKLLMQAGLDVTEVADYTGFPEMLDGRVKTLHPKIHGGLLGKRDDPEHLQAMERHGIERIDLLVVNLYPFVETINREHCSLADAIENIDIGGPAMLRAAAKNHGNEVDGVTVIIDPSDYETVLKEWDELGKTSYETRFRLAMKVYSHTAAYDGAISNYLSSIVNSQPAIDEVPERETWPKVMNIQMTRQQSLRYGENPHQSAAFYLDAQVGSGLLGSYQQLQGKELSYNNIADADAAWECVRAFDSTACVIVKHANPCGVAIAPTPLEAYQKAFKTDSTSAFGGIIAFNTEVDEVTAAEVSKQFMEVLIAPSFTAGALELLAAKKNVRVLKVPMGTSYNAYDLKRVGGGCLVQDPDVKDFDLSDLKVVSQRQPTDQQMQDLKFAWTVARFVKSNAIVFASNGMTMGVGAGQMSRIDSARIASIKAQNAGLSLKHTAAASDAFFPFRDGLDVIVEAGADCIIHPGGSIRDQEVIDAANEHNVVLVVTGMRHFRH
ncbi:phosphoribosylaminoimidazolecarboxamide formyltransferase [Basilea psittacipulmonis DSM 24701]|uniref:Bifunctional purine biosynthesis protein PurH n=2 Tax=Basilea TaxID=1472344 RepID=A0A077DHN7_9BURK|nr:phosphoribosylaminoimidazolecarboxamide formyltransferase [Basilea psittacipulmonis DSM 24701]